MENKNGSLIALLFLFGSLALLLIGEIIDMSNQERKNPYGPDSKMMNPVQYSEQSPVRKGEGNIGKLQSPFEKR